MNQQNALSRVPVKQLVKNAQVKNMIANVLHDREPQFATSIVSIVNSNRSLANVDQLSVIQSAMVAATLDLPIDQNLGYVWLVPYKGKAQAQIGYKGYIQLAQRSGQYRAMNAVAVHEGELISWNPLTEEVAFDPMKKVSDTVIGYIGYFKLLNGFEKTVYWTKEQIEAHRQRFSKAGGNSPWKSDFDAMAKKTVLKDLLTKWGPMSTQMAVAASKDEADPDPVNIEADETTKDKQAEDLFNQVSELPQESVKEVPKENTQSEQTTAKTAPKKVNKPTPVKAVEKEKKEPATEKIDDVNEIIKTVPNETPDEEQTELLNHWGEPVNE
ncbi:recombinase RecT [Ligilactobacillus animalis]|uniref:recombinase RecT n=1 Tax=Ligilactobacillus animalis TaxID=1605 RepID=UPI0026DEB2C2|nr:recombinase RecT [Ligilactobacillus animalis]MDO5882565.1 recombinase RecT [Ligilactobacillus animalis]